MKQIIDDASFETLNQPQSQWQIKAQNGVDIQPQVTDGELSLTIAGTSGQNAHAQLLLGPFEVKTGDVFEVSFSAKAKSPFTFNVQLAQANDPFSSLVAEDDSFGPQMLQDDWECYTHTFTAISDEPNATLNFAVGQVDNVVDLEDISLLRIDQAAQ